MNDTILEQTLGQTGADHLGRAFGRLLSRSAGRHDCHGRALLPVGVVAGAFLTAGAIAAAGPQCDPLDLFASSIEYDAGNGPHSVAVSDLNGDGGDDLVTANRSSDDISVLVNNGDGTFANAVNYGVSNAPRTAAIGDLNGDGDDDLAVSNELSNNVSVLLNRGDGTFADPVNYSVSNLPEFVAIGDLNGDGANDLAAATRDGGAIFDGGVSVLLNNGDGAFADAVHYDAGDARTVAIGDLNNDGANDLAIADYLNGQARVLFNNGDGTFAPDVAYPVGAGPRSIAIGDLNRDGADDLAVSNLATDDVSVLLNDGGGAFAAAIEYDVVALPHWVAIGDLNGDGANDLAVSNFTGVISVLLNNGDPDDPGFADAIEFGAGDEPRAVAIGNLDNNGANDLAVANKGSRDVSVLLNQCPADAVPGDLNGDDLVGVSDLLIFLGEWGRCADPAHGSSETAASCPADLDNDDHVGVSDLLILLSNWD